MPLKMQKTSNDDKNKKYLALIQTNYPLKINESVYFPEFNVQMLM